VHAYVCAAILPDVPPAQKADNRDLCQRQPITQGMNTCRVWSADIFNAPHPSEDSDCATQAQPQSPRFRRHSMFHSPSENSALRVRQRLVFELFPVSGPLDIS